VAIANGHVTGRTAGMSVLAGPSGDLGFQVLYRPDVDAVVNYRTSGPDGRQLKSTSVMLRDRRGNPYGAVCINMDLTEALMGKAFLDEFCMEETITTPLDRHVALEPITPEPVGHMVDRLIAESIEAVRTPVALMRKEDRMRAVERMEARGVFVMKGSIERAARALNVSRFSIYNYLKEIRNR